MAKKVEKNKLSKVTGGASSNNGPKPIPKKPVPMVGIRPISNDSQKVDDENNK